MLLTAHGMRSSGQSKSSDAGEEKGVRFMPEEFEVDTGELADEIREHQRLTGTEPEDERRGMTRRDVLVKGGVAAAAMTGAGALVGPAAARRSDVDKSGKYTGTLRVITLGVEW